MPSAAHGAPRWGPDELEEVTCFRCDDAGEPVHELDPFAVRRCTRCSLVFVSPRLDPVGRQALYDDPDYFEGRVYSTDGSDADRVGLATQLQRVWARGRLTRMNEHLDRPLADAQLLEAGCAYGLFLRAAQAAGARVQGQEFSRPAAIHVRTTLGVPVHVGQIEEIEPGSPGLDVICAWDVIEHVPDPARFLAGAHRLSRPGAVLALACPYITSLPARLLGARWWTLKPWEHLWHFSPGTLGAALDDAGFDVVEVVRSPLHAANRTRLDSMLVLARRR